MTSILNPFYDAIAWLVIHFHGWLKPALGDNWSWALAIVLLTLFMRVLLIPLFVKQIKSQRAMTALQPQIKALQAKYKNDKTKLNEEMMKLWKDAGVNPLMGCLPLIPQIPIFFALFHTLDRLRPTLCSTSVHCTAGAPYTFSVKTGTTSQLYTYLPFSQFHQQSLVSSAANAKIFGVPISAAFNSSSTLVTALHSSLSTTRILCAVLTLLMVATTFLTQRQMLARNAASGQSPIQGQQKYIMYFLPLIFLVYGYRFPVGVLLYWLTTNVWSLGQQFIVLRRMDNVGAVVSDPPPEGPVVGAKPVRPKPVTPGTASARALPAAGDPGIRSGSVSPPRSKPNPSTSNRKRKRRR